MFAASLLAWLPEGSEILHDIGRESLVGLSLHMEDDLEPSKLMKTAHKLSACTPFIWCLNQWLRLLLEWEWQAR